MRIFFTLTAVLLLGLSYLSWRMAPPPPGGKRTTLVWATDNNPTRVEQVALFNKLNPDLYLMIDPANAEQQKVIVQSMGGVGPDIFDSYGEFTLSVYVNSGIALDLTDRLAKKGIVVDDLIWPTGKPSCIRDGRTYGFPCNVNANAIWFNKDLFDAEGVPYPKPGCTWDELIATAKRMTKRNTAGKPVRFGFYMDFDWNSMLVQHGGRSFNADGTRCTLDTPEARDAFQLAHDLIYKHNVSPSPVQAASIASQGGYGSGDITFFMGGRVAMAWGGRWWLNLLRKDMKKRNLGVIPIPYAKVPTQIGGARCALVNSRSPRRELAVRFIEFLASKEYNELVNAQADALAPVMSYCEGPTFEHNPSYPEEDYNLIWRDVIARATPEATSPFVQGSELAPMNDQIDLVKNDLKKVPEALRDATKNMNERILRGARLRPHLGKLYEELTGTKP